MRVRTQDKDRIRELEHERQELRKPDPVHLAQRQS